MIELYASDVSMFYEEEKFKQFLSKASPFRQEKALRFKWRKDQALSLGAGLLLDYGLQQYSDTFPLPAEYEEGEFGKPFFRNDDKVKFNLSHSGTFVMCGISTDGEIGVDIEEMRPVDIDLMSRIFTKEEQIFLSESKEKERDFYKLWVCKESFMKIIGKGLNLSPRSFSICLEGDRITVTQEVSDKEFYFKLYDSISGYYMAVCSTVNKLPYYDKIHKTVWA